MSFMKGFGNAFSRSFETAQDRKHVEEQNYMQMAYDRIKERKTEYTEAQKADQEAIALARSLVETTGAPPGAVGNAAKWVRSGMSQAQIIENLKEIRFAPAPSVERPDNSPAAGEDQGLEVPTEASALNETAPMDMQTSPTVNEEAQNEAEGNFVTQAMDGLGSLFDKEGRRERMIGEAESKVAQEMGLTDEDLAMFETGYTPESLPEMEIAGFNPEADEDADYLVVETEEGGMTRAKRQSDGSYVRADGTTIEASEVTAVRTEDEDKALVEAIKLVGPQAEELSKQKSVTTTLARDITDLAGMVAENPSIISRTSQVSVIFAEIGNELAAIDTEFGGVIPGDFATRERQDAQRLTEAFMSEGATAEQAQLMAAKMVGVQYRLARIYNGEGNLSNSDVQAGVSRVLNTNDPRVFLANANDLITEMANTYNDQAETVMNSFEAQRAKATGLDVETLFGPINLDEITADIRPIPQSELDEDGMLAGPQGEVLEEGTLTEADLQRYGIGEEFLGRPYTLYENGLDIQ